MSVLKNPILRIGLLLAAFAVVATSLVSMTEATTREKIADNERLSLLKAINALVDSDSYNNDILTDTITLPAKQAIGTTEDSIVYRARNDDTPVAVIFSSIAPNGYSGKIKLLVAVNYDGSLGGVRVIKHKETPGLGDKIEEKKSDWILQFKDLSLTNPTESQWQVKKDGGDFDQFTGATITPRAVVGAVKQALYFFKDNRDDLFKVTAP